MNRIQALFFAVAGVVLLLAVSFSISLRSLWLTMLCTACAALFIGFGFMRKAKARRQSQEDLND